jgi:hypothetical protein
MNESSHAAEALGLSARVFRNGGRPAPIPLGAAGPVTNGPPAGYAALPAGQRVSQHIYLILTGEVVRAGVQVRTHRTVHLLTVSLRLRLRDEAPPELRVHASPPVHATIRPRVPRHGGLLYTYWVQCYQSGDHVTASYGSLDQMAYTLPQGAGPHRLLDIGVACRGGVAQSSGGDGGLQKST